MKQVELFSRGERMVMRDRLMELFNEIDVRAVDRVCANIGYELTIEDGKVTGYELIKEEKA